jgi:hypothetical protein
VPDFVIAGVMKGGTTTLDAMLWCNPAVVIDGHEIHYLTNCGKLEHGRCEVRSLTEKGPWVRWANGSLVNDTHVTEGAYVHNNTSYNSGDGSNGPEWWRAWMPYNHSEEANYMPPDDADLPGRNCTANEWKHALPRNRSGLLLGDKTPTYMGFNNVSMTTRIIAERTDRHVDRARS